jgi:hypothetical protein
MRGQVDIEGLSIGLECVIARNLLGDAGDKHPGSGSSYRRESVSGCSTAVCHGGEGQTVALAGHPPLQKMIKCSQGSILTDQPRYWCQGAPTAPWKLQGEVPTV